MPLAHRGSGPKRAAGSVMATAAAALQMNQDRDYARRENGCPSRSLGAVCEMRGHGLPRGGGAECIIKFHKIDKCGAPDGQLFAKTADTGHEYCEIGQCLECKVT